MRIFRAIALCSAVLLAGCADQIPPLNFSVPNVGASKTKVDAEVKSLTVSVGRPDEQVGEVNVTLAESAGMGISPGAALPALWKNSLQEALDRMAIFRDDAARKVSISVKILKLYTPSFGASFTSDTVARYEIIDRKDGSIIYTQDVPSTGTVPGDYAFMGLIRARESINRAVQNNISLFLQALETVDVSKPMFPTTAAK